MVILRVEKRFGRTYIVQKIGSQKVLRINNRTDQIQSISGEGGTGLYYDEMADVVPKTAKEVLILGLGGGTVARRLREEGYQGRIIGVENDPVVIELSYLYFDYQFVDEVIEADAKKFCRFSEDLFDCVIDDVYVNSEQKVHVDAGRIVRRGGLLISNNFPQKGISVVCM